MSTSSSMDRFTRMFGALGEAPPRYPFSFTYNGRPADESLLRWTRELRSQPIESGTRSTLTLSDDDSGLQVEVEAVLFDDFPAVEWVLHLRNTGAVDTPPISQVLPLDASCSAAKERAVTLHWAKGSECKPDDFAAHEQPLAVGATFRLETLNGRSSCGVLPFFNLDFDGSGVVVAVGWTGDWAAQWSRDETTVHLTAGMKQTHFVLHPGEQVRTPRILLLDWSGDRWDGQNLLRRFLLAHHSPRPNGELLQGPMCYANWGECRVDDHLDKLRWFAHQDIPLDVYWIDAGWHGDEPYREGATVFNTNWFAHVGNWYTNRSTYPEGMAPIGQAAAERGYRFLVWMEPERVYKDTQLATEHADWCFGPIGDNRLWNLGLPEAREYLTDRISNLLTDNGITLYRQDFNTDPAQFWSAADPPDRVGISEIRHIEGLYRFWDDLLERHPGLAIDNCSSGGRRIDLETISRSIPLWRSDVQCWKDFDPVSMQGQTQGLSPWVPLSAGVFEQPDNYRFRSGLGPAMVIATNAWETQPPPLPAEPLRRALEEHRELRPFFYGDFYPLTAYSLSHEQWAAWQWHRPDLGEGIVLCLRRPRSPYVELQARLRWLDEGEWQATNADTGEVRPILNGELTVRIEEMPGTALWRYRRRP